MKTGSLVLVLAWSGIAMVGSCVALVKTISLEHELDQIVKTEKMLADAAIDNSQAIKRVISGLEAESPRAASVDQAKAVSRLSDRLATLEAQTAASFGRIYQSFGVITADVEVRFAKLRQERQR